MKLTTWNVNSIRVRAAHVTRWVAANAPDVLMLQEIKTEAVGFPTAEFAALGYGAAVVGQKTYNGVAALCRGDFTTRLTELPGAAESPDQARYVEIETGGVVVAGIYLPNGNSGGEAGFAYKLRFLDRLIDRARFLIDAEIPFALIGDFNVCPGEADYAPGVLGPDDALLRPEVRARFQALIWLGLTDAVRAMQPTGPAYTFWDYQAGCWPRDRGLRIDHILLSPALAERLTACVRDRDERGRDQPSDHIPVSAILSDP